MQLENDYGMNERLTFEERIQTVFESNDVILQERLFDIQSDINLIWNRLEKLFEVYSNNCKLILDAYQKKGYKTSFSSEIFVSDPSKEAHKKNPVTVTVGFLDIKNSYLPLDKKINITFNNDAVMFLGDDGINGLENAEKMYPNFKQEFSEESLKGSIAHELSHWLDDSLHNNHLNKNLLRYIKSANNNKPIYSYAEWTCTTIHEIDANIHAIATVKQVKKETWDILTFNQLLQLKSSLAVLFKKIGESLTHKEYQKFVKKFFGRMVRENILGKNMRPIPFDELKNL